MKKVLLTLCAVWVFVLGYAQQETSQLDTAQLRNQPIMNVEKAKYLKDVNIVANTRFAMNNDFLNGDLTDSRFAMNEFRLEFLGKVGDRVHFRYRQFLAGFSPDIRSRDNTRFSVDIAEVKYDISDKVSITGGKMLSEWGAYEFETNPIDIVAFNHLINFSDPFVTGAVLKYRSSNKHLWSFQLTNSRTQTFQEAFGNVPGVEAAVAPLAVNVNWRGTFLDGKFSTIYSLSNYVEAKGKSARLIQLGNQYKSDKLKLQYDFKYSSDEIDRLGQVSMLVSNNGVYTTRALDARYMEHWVRAVYFFHKDWSITGIGMIAQDYWNGNNLAAISVPKDNLLRNSISYTLMLEYYVYWPQNLRFFAGWVTRDYRHTDYAKAEFGLNNFTTGQLLFGLITPLVFY
ncbi:MAG: hypothetical protein KF687_08980 [Cyclobacteriaceae bacterium]|nr:hypothetical protein [Cyclobacteriaceae bacterium]